ncbi:MAG TPA: hypothetical protein VHD56_17475 [Tepidisphaeraceae bacterium]|jgi:hypothetical protein|nr:hypothetical protein [Tepidisphaeraceae bacterium]
MAIQIAGAGRWCVEPRSVRGASANRIRAGVNSTPAAINQAAWGRDSGATIMQSTDAMRRSMKWESGNEVTQAATDLIRVRA